MLCEPRQRQKGQRRQSTANQHCPQEKSPCHGSWQPFLNFHGVHSSSHTSRKASRRDARIVAPPFVPRKRQAAPSSLGWQMSLYVVLPVVSSDKSRIFTCGASVSRKGWSLSISLRNPFKTGRRVAAPLHILGRSARGGALPFAFLLLAKGGSLSRFCPSPQSIQNWELKFTIDIRPDPRYPFACYLEQTSHTSPVTLPLTFDVSIICSLLRSSKKVKSFAIKQIQPLFPKHPGWGYPVGTLDLRTFRLSDVLTIKVLCCLSHPCKPCTFMQFRTLWRNGAELSAALSIICALFCP